MRRRRGILVGPVLATVVMALPGVAAIRGGQALRVAVTVIYTPRGGSARTQRLRFRVS